MCCQLSSVMSTPLLTHTQCIAIALCLAITFGWWIHKNKLKQSPRVVFSALCGFRILLLSFSLCTQNALHSSYSTSVLWLNLFGFGYLEKKTCIFSYYMWDFMKAAQEKKTESRKYVVLFGSQTGCHILALLLNSPTLFSHLCCCAL